MHGSADERGWVSVSHAVQRGAARRARASCSSPVDSSSRRGRLLARLHVPQ
jgi:hypothetical protein